MAALGGLDTKNSGGQGKDSIKASDYLIIEAPTCRKTVISSRRLEAVLSNNYIPGYLPGKDGYQDIGAKGSKPNQPYIIVVPCSASLSGSIVRALVPPVPQNTRRWKEIPQIRNVGKLRLVSNLMDQWSSSAKKWNVTPFSAPSRPSSSP